MVAPARPVVFLHVMKCGGTSVRVGLATGLTGHRTGPDVFELDGLVARNAVAGSNQDEWRFRDALLPYVLQTLHPALVLGHFRYRDRYEPLLGTAHFVTVVREPVERLVSLHRYRRYKTGVDVAVSVPFGEFLETNRWSKEGHTLVDTFCGQDGLDPHSEEAIAAAVTNLRRFDAVGFVDDLDGFTKQVRACTGKQISIPVLNRSPATEADADDLSPAALEHARELCRPDLSVYEQLRADRT